MSLMTRGKILKINDIEIRKLRDEEKTEMMNNFEKGITNYDPLSIIHKDLSEDCSKYWAVGKIKFEYCKNFLEFGWISNKAQLLIEKKINKLLNAFRLYKSIEVGIRNYFLKPLYTDNDETFQKWSYEIYKFGDFNQFLRKDSGLFGRNCFQNFNYKLLNQDIKGVKETYELIGKYFENPIDQISIALNQFSRAFEQNRGVYIFTDLMITLETLLNNPSKINKIVSRINNKIIIAIGYEIDASIKNNK